MSELRQRKKNIDVNNSTTSKSKIPDVKKAKKSSSLGCCGKLLIGWLMTVAVIIFVGFILGHTYAPPPPKLMQQMIKDCEEKGEQCPQPWNLFKFNAYQQLYLVKIEHLEDYVPSDVTLASIFGYTIGAIFLVEYSHVGYNSPVDEVNYEVDVMQFAAWGPQGLFGAWATHVVLTSPRMRTVGRQGVGLPAEVGDVKVKFDCQEEYGIVFTVSEDEMMESVHACLPGFDGRHLATVVNHTLPNLTGRIKTDYESSYDVLPHTNSKLTSFMLYLLTFESADIRLAPAVPQYVNPKSKSKGAEGLRRILSGYIFPYSTIFQNVVATTWDVAELDEKNNKWELVEQKKLF